MGILNRLFGSAESVAKEIELDDEAILKIWKKYRETEIKKIAIIYRLKVYSNFEEDLQELKILLESELVDISDEEKEEAELISDLEAMEQYKTIVRVHKLEQCLGYAETKYEYAHSLLHHLYSVLKSQMHIVQKLIAGSKDAKRYVLNLRLISHLQSQMNIEKEIITKIEGIKDFHSLFLALARGEHIIRVLDTGRKRMLRLMSKRMNAIFSQELTEGITFKWADGVASSLDDKIHEWMNKFIAESYDYIDFEYVNRPEFVVLVRETIQRLRPRKVSDRMIDVFVHLFREWYNHERREIKSQ